MTAEAQTQSEGFVLSRVFDAPRDLLWQCFTDPERMKQWWGPKGVKILRAKMDMRPGGSYHYGMQTPDGTVPDSSSWAGWDAWSAVAGSGAFLVIERVNLASVYDTDLQSLTITLNNRGPATVSYNLVQPDGTIQGSVDVLAGATATLSRQVPRVQLNLYKAAGANRLMAVDLHTAQIQGFFDGPVDHLFALPILAEYLETKLDTTHVTIVSPDAGRVRVAERWTDRMNCGLAIIHKRRDSMLANEVKVHEVVGDVAGRTCILVDDMIDTAGTITKAAEALMENGAAEVVVAATHAVLSGPAVDRLKNSPISEVVVTDTLPVPEELRFDKLTVLTIAPLLARAISEVFEDGSVTSLFDGAS